MKEIQRQTLYNSITAYLGILLGYLNIGILFPFILTTEQIGLYSVIAAVGNIASNFVKFGTPYIIVRYFPFFKNDANNRARFNGFQLFLVAVGAAFFVLAYTLLQPYIVERYQVESPLFATYNHLVVPFTIFMLLFELFYSFCRANYFTVAAGFARDLLFRIAIFALIICYHFDVISFEQFIWIYSFVYALPTIFLTAYLIIKNELPVSFRFGSLPQIKEMLIYGGFVSLGSLSTVLINDLDKIMITDMVGLGSAGVYAIAAFFGSVIVTPARSLNMIAGPVIAQFMKDGEMDKIARVYSKSSITLLASGLLLFIGLYINLHNIFAILPPEFAAGYYVIVFIGLSKIFEMATGTNGEIIMNSKYFRYDLVFNIILVTLAICSNLIFIPLYGISGAALAMAISILLYDSLKGLFVYWKFRIQPFTIQTLYCLIIGVIVLAVNYVIPRWGFWPVDLLIRSTIAVVIYVPLLLFFKISPDINDLVAKMLAEARKRVGM
ncbi:flippase [soil metagenome]